MLRVPCRQAAPGRLGEPGEKARLFHWREAGSGRYEQPDEPRPRLLRLARPKQPPQLVAANPVRAVPHLEIALEGQSRNRSPCR